MSFIRPEVAAKLSRWREAIAAGLCAVVAGWLVWLGGWLLTALGVAGLVLSLGWGVIALRRLRFLRAVAAPGVVEVDEGQIGYLGPNFGGFLAIDDLTDLRLIALHGARHWRLATRNGEVLTIPVDAAGAEKLYDAFAALPGIDMARLAAAISRDMGTAPLWTRARPSLPRH